MHQLTRILEMNLLFSTWHFKKIQEASARVIWSEVAETVAVVRCFQRTNRLAVPHVAVACRGIPYYAVAVFVTFSARAHVWTVCRNGFYASFDSFCIGSVPAEVAGSQQAPAD